MSATAPDGHSHERTAPVQRRDMLGLASLFPAGSSFVPLSDIDAGAAYGAEQGGACSLPGDRRAPGQGSHCAGCALPCPSETNWRSS